MLEELERYEGTDEQIARIHKIVSDKRDMKGAVLPILIELQSVFSGFSADMLKLVSYDLKLPVSHIAGTASYYSFFSTKCRGKYIIRMCKSAPCHMKNAAETLKAFQNVLGITVGETTAVGRFTLETTGCLGLCTQAPAVMINKQVYTSVKPEDVETILENYKQVQ